MKTRSGEEEEEEEMKEKEENFFDHSVYNSHDSVIYYDPMRNITPCSAILQDNYLPHDMFCLKGFGLQGLILSIFTPR